MLLESLGKPLRCGHRSHASVALRHGSDGPIVDDVNRTGGRSESMETATDPAARMSAARLGGAVEVRPVEKY
jgi:hypothetical protein